MTGTLTPHIGSAGTVDGDATVNGDFTVRDDVNITGDLLVKGGVPWADVRAFGNGVGQGSVSVDDAALQAAIAALPQTGSYRGGVIYLAPGMQFKFSTMLNLDDFESLTFKGGGVNSANHATRLTWTGGASSGSAIRLRSADGIVFDGLKITYSDAAYDGDLIACGSLASIPTTNLAMRDCWIGGENSRTAASDINLNGCVGAEIRNCSIYNAVHGIKGAISDFANDVTIQNCLFYGHATSSIRNIGQGWTVLSNGFERIFSGAAGAVSSALDTSWPARGLLYAGNWHGDMTANSGTWVNIHGFGLAFIGNTFDMRTFSAPIAISAWTTNGLTVVGNDFREGAKCVEFAGTQSGGWLIAGNAVTSTTAPFPSDATLVRAFIQDNNAEGFQEIRESGDVTAPLTNGARLYAKDNGSGKTQLVVRFPTGAVQVIATEP
jgi:hypothetical protein